MATKNEMLADFTAQHNALGSQQDAPDIPEFDKRHQKIWGKCDEELGKRLVKLEAQDNSTPEEQAELQELRLYLD